MADPFVAEIRTFPFNFAPKGWAWCNGQLLPISQNTALFSLLGTNFGGDGKSTFALPDLDASCAIGVGQGPGLSDRLLGEQSGTQNVTLIHSEMPMRNHVVQVQAAAGDQSLPTGNAVARAVGATPFIPAGAMGMMAPQCIGM